MTMNNIFVVGYPKVGSSWLCRLLGDILNSPIGSAYQPANNTCIATEGHNRQGDYYIGHGHLEIVNNSSILIPNHRHINPEYLTDEQIIFIYRDPRDVIVSANHHWGIDDIQRTIDCVANGKWPILHGGGLEKFYRMWLDSDLPVAKIRYEILSSKTKIVLDDMLYNRLQIGYHYGKLTKSIERQSFANRVEWTQENGDNLNYGKDFQLRFLRKGIVGDWRNVFSNKDIKLCTKHFGDLIEELGYKL